MGQESKHCEIVCSREIFAQLNKLGTLCYLNIRNHGLSFNFVFVFLLFLFQITNLMSELIVE